MKTLNMRQETRARRGVFAAVWLLLLATAPAAAQDHDGHAMESPWSCDATATPAAGHEGMHGGSSTNETAAPEFDQLYIDMMLPHHESIIALSQAALPNLTDPGLIEIAEAIITAQTAENEQMKAWRMEWYGSPDPATDEHSMMLMLEAMPVGTMDEMMQEMDPAWQVGTFCAASNPDVAYAEQAIRHHQMAVDVSVIAVEQAVHPELVEFAAGVIEAQQAEIDELNAILDQIAATPAA